MVEVYADFYASVATNIAIYFHAIFFEKGGNIEMQFSPKQMASFCTRLARIFGTRRRKLCSKRLFKVYSRSNIHSCSSTKLIQKEILLSAPWFLFTP